MTRRIATSAIAIAIALGAGPGGSLAADATSGSRVPATGLVPPASLRFAPDTAGEVPDFQRHVLPLMGRLGCNTRSCHGSFQGAAGSGSRSSATTSRPTTRPSCRQGRRPRRHRNPRDRARSFRSPRSPSPTRGASGWNEGRWHYHVLAPLDRGRGQGARSNPSRFDRAGGDPAPRSSSTAPGHTVPAEGGRPLGRRLDRRRHLHQPVPHQRRSRRRGRRRRRRHQQGEGRHARRRLLRQRRRRHPGDSAGLRPGRAQLSRRRHADEDRRAGRRPSSGSWASSPARSAPTPSSSAGSAST